jgi:hypothetical protein
MVIGVGFAKDKGKGFFGSEPKIIYNDIFVNIDDIEHLMKQLNNVSDGEPSSILGLVVDQKVPGSFLEVLASKLKGYPMDIFQFTVSENGSEFGFVKTKLSDIAD